MMRLLDVKGWLDTGFVTHAKKQYPVRFVPGSHGKIALYIPDEKTPERKGCFFWYNRSGHRKKAVKAKRGYWSRYPDIYTLHRSLLCMQWRSALEIDALIKIANDLQGVHLRLCIDMSMTEEVENELRQKLGNHVEVLRRALDPRKVEAHGQICCIYLLRDNRNRRNPVALCARGVAAETRVSSRIDESRNIAVSIGYYAGLTRQLILALEQKVNDAVHRLIHATKDPQFVVKNTLTAGWMDARQLTLPPFTTTSGFVCDEIHTAAELLKQGKTREDEARAIISRAIEGLRLKQTRRDLERATVGVSEAEVNGGMTNGRKDRVIWIINQALRDLDEDRITEVGFKKPVRNEVTVHLRTTRGLLAAPEITPDKKSLKNAKETLKKATALL